LGGIGYEIGGQAVDWLAFLYFVDDARLVELLLRGNIRAGFICGQPRAASVYIGWGPAADACLWRTKSV